MIERVLSVTIGDEYKISAGGLGVAWDTGKYKSVSLQKCLQPQNVPGIKNLYVLVETMASMLPEGSQPFDASFVITSSWENAEEVAKSAIDNLAKQGDVKTTEVGFHRERFRIIIASPANTATRTRIEDLAKSSEPILWTASPVYGLMQMYLVPAKS